MDLSPDSLSIQIQAAMKAGDKTRVSVLRLLLTAIRNAEVTKMGDLSEEEAVAVVAREVRKRDEAAEEFRKVNRLDRADAENAEAEILRQWLPEQLSDEELDTIVAETIAELGVTGMSAIGKAIGAVMEKVKGKADGKVVSAKVKARLGEST